jgi:hypothetical protein
MWQQERLYQATLFVRKIVLAVHVNNRAVVKKA